MAPYVVPDHGLGAVRSIPAERVNTEFVNEVIESVEAESVDLQVELGLSTETDGFQALFNEEVIADFSEETRNEYNELEWIMAAGLTPQVTVRVNAPADEAPTLDMRVPNPELCLPYNPPPTSPWIMLPEGPTHSVDLYPDALENEMHEELHLLVSLHPCPEASEDNPSLETRISGRPVGVLRGPALPALLAAVATVEARGVVPIVRAFLSPVDDVPTLNVSAAGVADPLKLPVAPFPAVSKPDAAPSASNAPTVHMAPVSKKSTVTPPVRVAPSSASGGPSMAATGIAGAAAGAAAAGLGTPAAAAEHAENTIPPTYSTNRDAERAARELEEADASHSLNAGQHPQSKILVGITAVVGVVVLAGLTVLSTSGVLPSSSNSVTADSNNPSGAPNGQFLPYSSGNGPRAQNSEDEDRDRDADGATQRDSSSRSADRESNAREIAGSTGTTQAASDTRTTTMRGAPVERQERAAGSNPGANSDTRSDNRENSRDDERSNNRGANSVVSQGGSLLAAPRGSEPTLENYSAAPAPGERVAPQVAPNRPTPAPMSPTRQAPAQQVPAQQTPAQPDLALQAQAPQATTTDPTLPWNRVFTPSAQIPVPAPQPPISAFEEFSAPTTTPAPVSTTSPTTEAEPTVPAEPPVSAEPAEPTVPSEPADPTVPEPTVPAEPSTPAQPGNNGQSGNNGQPGQGQIKNSDGGPNSEAPADPAGNATGAN